jgi:large subunit ribosomal protein L31e
MAEAKSHKLEREYVIPLRMKWKRVPRYKKTNRAVKAIKEFLVQHMKIRDRDLDKIKVDKFLNEFMWSRGIRNPPAKIKVKAIKEGDEVRVELFELPQDLKFKKARFDARNKKAVEIAEKKKSTMERLKEAREGKEQDNKNEEGKTEEIKEKEEKKAASAEASKEREKEAAKRSKKETKQDNQPKHQRRMALQK